PRDWRLSKSSGAIITSCGITSGSIRGQFIDMPDGSVARPTLVLIDDPMDKRKANSAAEIESRMSIIDGDIMYLCGQDQVLSGFAAMTVIRPGDVADQLLDTEKRPEFNGLRTKFLESFPDDMELWEKWYDVRRQEGIAASNLFYDKHAVRLETGASVAWASAFDPKKYRNALEKAMDLYFRVPAEFYAEFQNDPSEGLAAATMATVDEILEHCPEPSLPQLTVPLAATHLVGHIDIHDKLLYYTLYAPEGTAGSGTVIDYGTWPRQKLREFRKDTIRYTLKSKYRKRKSDERGLSVEDLITRGLGDLLDDLCNQEYRRIGGGAVKIDRLLIDVGYQQATVEEVIAKSPHRAILAPAWGLGIRARNEPICSRLKKGEFGGDEWKMLAPSGPWRLRRVRHDTNMWKTRVHQSISLRTSGAKNGLRFYGKHRTGRPLHGTYHRMIADHCLAETFVEMTSSIGRRCNEWDELPGRDNHLFDNLVGSFVAASMEGCRWSNPAAPSKAPNIDQSRPAKPGRGKRKKKIIFAN
ncbi:MAG: hypothetical protein HN370_09750, partial [Phycisphaerales bacterium]|nr:hypothetical protein [Phycisphaerales bacterium]